MAGFLEKFSEILLTGFEGAVEGKLHEQFPERGVQTSVTGENRTPNIDTAINESANSRPQGAMMGVSQDTLIIGGSILGGLLLLAIVVGMVRR